MGQICGKFEEMLNPNKKKFDAIKKQPIYLINKSLYRNVELEIFN